MKMKMCDKKECTGCGMCVDICPHDAIEMRVGENGFLFPAIDPARCMNCGLCSMRCPANLTLPESAFVQEVYAAWNKDSRVRHRSTSGGVFPLLAQSVLKKGGAVAGVCWCEDFSVEHRLIEETSSLYLCCGSKYVQSNTNHIYQKIKLLLKQGRWVLFSGTPCQVHALRSYLHQEYEKLILVDLVCHGVPSQQMLQRYLCEQSDHGAKKISSLCFRTKIPHWDYSSVTIEFSNAKPYQALTLHDPYFCLFNVGFSLRDSCHHCKYTSMQRVADITLMDYWGFKPRNFKMGSYNRGVSCILVNSEKGKQLFNEVTSCLTVEKRTPAEALRTNRCLSDSFAPDPDAVTEFWKDYNEKMSVELLCAKYIKQTMQLPDLLFLRRMKQRFGWIVKR